MTADTAATAALGPEPITGLGTWGDRRRHPRRLGRLPRLGTPARRRAHLLAPDPAPRPHRRHRPRHRRTRPRLRHGRRASARRVRQPPRGRLPGLLGRSTSATPGSSSAPGSPEARASPRRSPRTRACSPPSPRRRSARSTPAGCAARPCCPAAPAATPRPAAARTAATSPARPATSRPTPGSASRCAATATTTPPPCCSTPTRATCGAGSPPTCPATWPAAWASPRRRSAPWSASGSSRSPNTRHAASSTSTPSSAWTPPARTTSPRPPGITADLLCDAIGQAAAAAAARHRAPGPGRHARLRRADRRPAHPPRHDLPGTGQALNGRGRGQLHRQVRHQDPHRSRRALPAASGTQADIERCAARPTTGGMITTAWQLGSNGHRHPRFRAWAHMLGYGGHFLTKSRRYSVTFGQLRDARTDHRRAARHPGRRTRPLGPPPRRDRRPGPARTWTYAGTGYTAAADAELALASAARAREHSRPGRQRRITNLPADQGRAMNT